MAERGSWVLRETLASKRAGHPVYFECYAGVGPKATDDVAKAMRFASERDAKLSPAYSHALSFYEPEQLPEETP